MTLKEKNQIEQTIGMVKSLYDTMLFMESAKVDIAIPVSVLYTFRLVLKQIELLLMKTNEEEKEM